MNRFTNKPFDNVDLELLEKIRLLKNNNVLKTYRVNSELLKKVRDKIKENNDKVTLADIIKGGFISYLNK